MKTDDIREKYLTFFETKGCVRRPSDVLVPRWDPSVLFTPAGMNQFKDHFLGRCKLEFTRATTCQKCLRTGDIDNVGRTAYHHTFFEMLGNFSFGDYFKREAIHWAWEFLTDKRWLGLDPERLSATVYLDDDEAADIWTGEIGLTVDRVQRLGEDENFWPANAPSQGPDGVCGPCSEIYFHTDTGEVEIWNLVFTQFNRVGSPPDNLRPLPKKNIDTGMGLERAAAVLQGVDSNFHIDILRPIVEAAAEVCGMRYEPQGDVGRRLRRIADHVRACTFAVHENVYPGPNKEKYVVKRLLRRAVLDGHQMGVREPFLHKLVGTVAEMMKNPYPELTETVDRVARVIQREEEGFLETIDAGLDRVERIFAEMRKENRGIVSGEEAAEMYQTHGFPPELFEALAAERNLMFDWSGYSEATARHGIESGAGEKVEVFRSTPVDALKKAVHSSRFVGYQALEATDAKVVGIIAGDHLCEKIDEVGHEHSIVVVLDKTPFYGEMGGQVGDTGELVGPGFRFEVTDSQVDGGLTLHRGHLREGEIGLGATVTARVDTARRQGIRRAHSATHLLHFALQKHLGKHAQQQGSKVDRDWLRFDFGNPGAVSPEDLVRIEDEVNAKVMDAAPIVSKNMPLAEARTTGAMMLFGEKYPDVVRVVSAGDFSKELCGGTHLDNSGQVGLFKIIGEESVAAGTRRITAITGPSALKYVRRTESELREVSSTLGLRDKAIVRVVPGGLEPGGKALLVESSDTLVLTDKVEVSVKRGGAAAGSEAEVSFQVAPVVSRASDLVKENRELKKRLASGGGIGVGDRVQVHVVRGTLKAADPVGQLLELAQDLHGTKVVVEELAGGTASVMRDLIDQLRRKAAPIAVLLASRQDEGKVMLIAGLSRDLVQKGLDAVQWVRPVATLVQGSGGGRPDMAQAGGKDAEKIPEALTLAAAKIREMLGAPAQ